MFSVLFLNPPYFNKFSRESRSPAVAKSGTLYYPKWLCYAAGVSIQNGFDTHVLDCPADLYDVNYVNDYIENKNIKALICDTSTPSIVNDIEVIKKIKTKHPNLKVMLVGRHVSVLPVETFNMSGDCVDAIAFREYEYTVRDWLFAVKEGANYVSIEGIVWKSHNEVIKNKDRPSIHNLDELPFVSEIYKKYLNIENYFYGHSLHPLVVFDTSRGCPYKCSFCVYPQTFSGHIMRFRSVNNVADEFDYIKRELPQVKTVMLEDDTFIINKKRTLELANELISRNNRISYDSNCRADLDVDVEFFKTLKKSGARLFCVGFESGDTEVIKHISKNNNPKNDIAYQKRAMDFTQKCKEGGIMVHGCFMVGNLNETPETMQKTLDFALELQPDTAQFFPIMVYPGTSAYKEAKDKGLLIDEDYSKWLTEDGLHNSRVNLPNVTYKQMVDFCDHARRKFYFNKKYLLKKIIQSFLDFDEFKRNLKGFRTLFKYLINGSFKNN